MQGIDFRRYIILSVQMTKPAQMVVLRALKSDKQQKSEKGNMLKGQLVILPTSVVYSPTKDLLGKGNSVKLHV